MADAQTATETRTQGEPRPQLGGDWRLLVFLETGVAHEREERARSTSGNGRRGRARVHVADQAAEAEQKAILNNINA